MKYILILIIIGGGGSGPRPAASIDHVEFNDLESCKLALKVMESTPVEYHGGPTFRLKGRCVPKGK